MKKMILLLVMVILCLSCSVSVFALEPEAVVGSTVIAANEAFEGTLITRIVGRAGAATLSTAKGVVFEAYYAAQENVKNLFSGAKTLFTKSSTAKQVDLVKMKNGKVLERFQLKDTPNSVDNVVAQVKSGKYHQAQIVGTKETAKAYNAKAASQGLKQMKNSNVSTKTTSRIAGKSFGKLAPVSNLFGYVGKAGGIGAVLDGGISLAESIVKDDDPYAVFANTTEGVASGFFSGSAAALAGEAVTVIVVAVGGGELITIIVPAAVAFGIGCLTDYAMDSLIDEDALADATEAAVSFAKEKGAIIANTVCTAAENVFEYIAG